MNGAHLHLILTHVPVLGVAFGTVLLGFGLLRNNRVIQQTGLAVLVFAGLEKERKRRSREPSEPASHCSSATKGPGCSGW